MNMIRIDLILGCLFLSTLSTLVSAQTHDQLVAGAKKEGRLVLYASAAVQQLQVYFAAFNKRYPFIKTEYYRTISRSSSAVSCSNIDPSSISQT